MKTSINFKMFTALPRAHMATRALELAHAEVEAEEASGQQLQGWRSRDAASFIRRALFGAAPMPVTLGGPGR